MNYMNMTKHSKLFDCYWGAFESRQEDAEEMIPIFNNRNKFAADYELVTANFKCRFPSHGIQGIDYDHPEAYKCKNGKAILLFSNYAESDFPSSIHLRRNGFVEYLQLYNSSAITFIRVFDSTREMTACCKKLEDAGMGKDSYNGSFYGKLTKYSRNFNSGWGLNFCSSESEEKMLLPVIRDRNRFAKVYNITGGRIWPANILGMDTRFMEDEIYRRKWSLGYVMLIDASDEDINKAKAMNRDNPEIYQYIHQLFRVKRSCVVIEAPNFKKLKGLIAKFD